MAVDWQNYTSPIIGTPTIGGGLTDNPADLEFLGGGLLGSQLGTALSPSVQPTPTTLAGTLGGPLQSVVSNNWLGYAALAWGGYRAFRSKRLNLMTLALMVYGLWAIGWISPSLLPRNSDGGINWMVLAICAVMPPAAAALIAGVSGVIVSVIARSIFKRRRSFRRRFRSYRRRFYNYRRRYYNRRRY